MINPFLIKTGKQTDDEDGGDYTLLSLYMEELLLSYFYLLSKRKVLHNDIELFWSMDTYTIYTLLGWEYKAIKVEEEKMKENDNNNNSSGNSGDKVEDHPDMISLFNENVEPLEDE